MMKKELTPHVGGQSDALETRISCSVCSSSDDLLLENWSTVGDAQDGLIDLEYSCGACESYFAISCAHDDAAEVFELGNSRCGMLQYGEQYLHCGQIMEEGELEISALKVKGGDLFDAPAVQVEMTVLKCACGFQMSVPTEG